jgi:ABC-type sugar transport system permease subunit
MSSAIGSGPSTGPDALPARLAGRLGGGLLGRPRGGRFDLFPYLLMLPGLLLVMFVTLYPIVFAVNYSLMRTQVFKQLAFVGLANYARLFTDPRFQTNLRNSLFFVLVGVALTWTFGLGLALLLRRQTWGNAILKTIVLIPWVTNQVVLALMWKWLLNGEFSPVNYLLGLIDLPGLNPLISTAQALPTLTFVNAWRATGFSLLLMLAGLSAIPVEVEEAAEIDGASRWKQLWYVIIPLLKPISLACFITLTISFFNIIVLPMDLTGGGPLNSTEVLSLRLYREGFQYYNMGSASAITLVLVGLDLILAWAYYKLIRAETYYR